MEKPEEVTKYRKKEERVVLLANKECSFKSQEIILTESGRAYVILDNAIKLEIDYDLARIIVFFIKLKNKENKSGYSEMQSELAKKIVMLSNCHRVALFSLGFTLDTLEGQEFSSGFIDDNFIMSDLKFKSNEYSKISDTLNSLPKSEFPVLANVFSGFIDHENFTYSRHSFLILGKIPNTNIYICFHKDGLGDNKLISFETLDVIFNNELEGEKNDYLTLSTRSLTDSKKLN